MAEKSFQDDAELITQLKGDSWPDALGELWSRHLGLLWSVAIAATRNEEDAADAVSEAFVRLADRAAAGKLTIDQSFRALATTVVRNAAISSHRKTSRTTPDDLSSFASRESEGTGPLEASIASSDSEVVANAFARLPERSRIVLWLSEVEGMSARDVASTLGLSANNVSQICTRSKVALREQWIAAHLGTSPAAQPCKAVRSKIPAALAGTISTRRKTAFDAHLISCSECRDVEDRVRQDSAVLRGLAVPLVGSLAAASAGMWALKASPASAEGLAARAASASLRQFTWRAPSSLRDSVAASGKPALAVAVTATMAVVAVTGLLLFPGRASTSSADSASVEIPVSTTTTSVTVEATTTTTEASSATEPVPLPPQEAGTTVAQQYPEGQGGSDPAPPSRRFTATFRCNTFSFEFDHNPTQEERDAVCRGELTAIRIVSVTRGRIDQQTAAPQSCTFHLSVALTDGSTQDLYMSVGLKLIPELGYGSWHRNFLEPATPWGFLPLYFFRAESKFNPDGSLASMNCWWE